MEASFFNAARRRPAVPIQPRQQLVRPFAVVLVHLEVVLLGATMDPCRRLVRYERSRSVPEEEDSQSAPSMSPSGAAGSSCVVAAAGGLTWMLDSSASNASRIALADLASTSSAAAGAAAATCASPSSHLPDALPASSRHRCRRRRRRCCCWLHPAARRGGVRRVLVARSRLICGDDAFCCLCCQ